jgi:type I restriction enzyme S subunit
MSFPSARLDELCDIKIGRTPARAVQRYWGRGYPWLSIADMNGSMAIDTTKEEITESAVNECNMKPVVPGTVLLSFKLSIGKVGIAAKELFTNEAIAALPVKTHDRLLEGYLAWALRSANSLGVSNRAVMGATLNKKSLAAIEIPLAPLDEQRRIAAILDHTDDLRRKRREAIGRLEELYFVAFVEMLGEPISNPKGWPMNIHLGDVAEIVSGITKGRKLNGAYVRSVPYLAVANVQDRSLNLQTVKTIEATEAEIMRYRLLKDDLVLTEGGDPDKLGRGALWPGEIRDCIHQNHIFRVRLDANIANPVFINWLVGGPRGKAYFLKSAKQTTGIASINMTQLRDFPLILPPIDLQRAFASRVVETDKIKAHHRAHLAKLDALFASLQHRAFRGEL